MVVTRGSVQKVMILFILDDVIHEVKISAGFRFLLMLHGNKCITNMPSIYILKFIMPYSSTLGAFSSKVFKQV